MGSHSVRQVMELYREWMQSYAEKTISVTEKHRVRKTVDGRDSSETVLGMQRLAMAADKEGNRRTLKAQPRLVYGALLSFADDLDCEVVRVTVGVSDLARQTCLSPRGVMRALAGLVAAGMIKRDRDFGAPSLTVLARNAGQFSARIPRIAQTPNPEEVLAAMGSKITDQAPVRVGALPPADIETTAGHDAESILEETDEKVIDRRRALADQLFDSSRGELSHTLWQFASAIAETCGCEPFRSREDQFRQFQTSVNALVPGFGSADGSRLYWILRIRGILIYLRHDPSSFLDPVHYLMEIIRSINSDR